MINYLKCFKINLRSKSFLVYFYYTTYYNFMAVLESTTAGVWIGKIKTAWYIVSIGMFEYLAIPSEQLSILATLMFIDFITGVGKQFRIDPKEIKSHLAWLWVMKKIATLISLLSVALVFKGLSINEQKYVVWILSIFITAEGYSTLQNVYAIRTGKILPEFDVISIVLKNIGEFFKQKIEDMIKKGNQ